MILSTHGILSKGGSGLVLLPETIAYLAQCTGTISDGFKTALNTFIAQCITDGNWALLDRLWIHATENQQNATISLVNPTSTPITEVNTPTWTANQGYAGNTSNMYGNTNFTPSTHGVNYTQDIASIGQYITTNASEASFDMGVLAFVGASFAAVAANFVGNLYVPIQENGAFTGPTASDAKGMNSGGRTALASNIYKNGSSVWTRSNSSSNIPNIPLYILALNNAGVPSSFNSKRVAMSFVGGAINQSTFYTAFQAFATARGFNV